MNIIIAILLFLYASNAEGHLETTFARCCALGANWARKEEICSKFPNAVEGEADEDQTACVTSGSICCLRFYREAQCEVGKRNAKDGAKYCPKVDSIGGEYAKDCCDGCKIGLNAGNLGEKCVMEDFNFGFPWNEAYVECCLEASTNTSANSIEKKDVGNDEGTPLDELEIPDSENLCLRFPGQLCSHICIPIRGSYTCKCRSGFSLSPDKKTCTQHPPEDRCKTHNPCDHKCRDTGISIECSCRKGFQLSSDQKSCKDIDECHVGTHNCIAGRQVCHNRVGSYICVNADGSSSAPISSLNEGGISEGSISSHPRPGTIRTFGAQGFPGAAGANKFLRHGICPPGYTFNIESRACDDVDECTVGPDLCGRHVPCKNTIGSYSCQQVVMGACPAGFVFDMILQTCIDLDECTIGSGNCKAGEFCLNTQGGYECQKSFNPTDCPAGYKYNKEDRTCEDVNECEEELHGCHPESEKCVNIIGSYECNLKCEDGFKYLAIPRSCVDIDECLENEHTCQTGTEICINLIGSFRCKSRAGNDILPFDFNSGPLAGKIPLKKIDFEKSLVKECPHGYSYDLSSDQCLDVDECRAEIHNCSSRTHICINTLGGFICINQNLCLPGYTMNKENEKCEDIDECKEGFGKCMPGQICVNTIGTFECQVECRDGFSYNPRDHAICVDVDECLENPCESGSSCINTEGSYTCKLKDISCQAGYENRSGSCIDVDECKTGEHNCEEFGQRCINSFGSYRCSALAPCPNGFKRDPKSFRCIDLDECAEGVDQCIVGEQCVNQYGRYKCTASPTSCKAGYVYNSITTRCQDVDECRTAGHNCSMAIETCENSIGSYSCLRKARLCDIGYRFDNARLECADIDECQEKTFLCNTEREECMNLEGGYKCNKITVPPTTTERPSITDIPARIDTCENGYSYNINTRKCTDLNECQLGIHNCAPSQRCDNTHGSFTCTRVAGCGTGYTLNQNTGKCEDINECTETPDNCKSNEKCINTVGSFRCLPKINCGRGYHMNELGTQCIDINECEGNAHKCEGGQQCVNRPGGYVCQCPTGFRLNIRRNCQDINECEEYYHNICGYNADCSNTPGSYECNCNPGFEKSSDGKTCTDINECTTNQNLCQHKCTNIWGSHVCSCNSGYQLRNDNRTCSDIDECEEMRGRGKLCIGLCVNTPGTFRCSCPQGYILDSDKRTCQDINECDGVGVCRTPKQICVNTRGGHRCNDIRCPEDYVRDPTQRNRCKKQIVCGSGDQECRQKPLMYSYNFLPLASNMTLRSQGQIDLFTMRGPAWSSTTVQFELKLDSAVSDENVPLATRDHFKLSRSAFNQVVLVLVKSLVGPQEVMLSLNMKLYHNGLYEGSAISKLAIFVSTYDF